MPMTTTSFLSPIFPTLLLFHTTKITTSRDLLINIIIRLESTTTIIYIFPKSPLYPCQLLLLPPVCEISSLNGLCRYPHSPLGDVHSYDALALCQRLRRVFDIFLKFSNSCCLLSLLLSFYKMGRFFLTIAFGVGHRTWFCIRTSSPIFYVHFSSFKLYLPSLVWALDIHSLAFQTDL